MQEAPLRLPTLGRRKHAHFCYSFISLLSSPSSPLTNIPLHSFSCKFPFFLLYCLGTSSQANHHFSLPPTVSAPIPWKHLASPKCSVALSWHPSACLAPIPHQGHSPGGHCPLTLAASPGGCLDCDLLRAGAVGTQPALHLCLLDDTLAAVHQVLHC